MHCVTGTSGLLHIGQLLLYASTVSIVRLLMGCSESDYLHLGILPDFKHWCFSLETVLINNCPVISIISVHCPLVILHSSFTIVSMRLLARLWYGSNAGSVL